MRILFVNEKAGYFGGIEQNVADTAAGLRGRGHECHLAYKELTGRQDSEYQSIFDSCVPLYPFAKATERTRPDVIYIHKADVRSLGDTPNGARVVRMVHDHDLCCPRRHKYYAWNNRICDWKAGWRCYLDLAFLGRRGLVNISDKMDEMRRNQRLTLLLAGSKAMRDELLLNGFPVDRVEILPPVVRMAERPMPPIPAGNHILYVGQLIRGKGVDLLLRALPHLKNDFHLTIAGTGNAQSRLEQLSAKLGLAAKVKFAGWVSPQALGEYYANAKLVVVPSRWPEPFGMIGLEAMHYGRPVVGFRVGGIPDWLEHGSTGLLAPEQNTRALAQNIDQLLADPQLCEKLGAAAQSRVREKFSFDLYLDRLETLLSAT